MLLDFLIVLFSYNLQLKSTYHCHLAVWTPNMGDIAGEGLPLCNYENILVKYVLNVIYYWTDRVLFENG